MKRLHILLLTDLSAFAGTELSTLSIGKWLTRAGHDVTVVATNHPLTKEFVTQGVRVVIGAVDDRDVVGVLKGVRDIRRVVLDRQVDVIHAQNAWSAGLAGLASRMAILRRVPVIWHCRGVNHSTYRTMAWLSYFLLDFVIANCDSERRRLLKAGLPTAKTRTVYNFPNVDFPETLASRDMSLLREWRIDPTCAVVGTACRLAPDRGVEFLLQAISQLPPDVRHATRFVVVGDGHMREHLQALALDAGVADVVVFAGARRDMGRVYSALDVVVNPVLVGCGTGNLNSEAMAWAKPVVTTSVGGIPELVDHERTGLLVPAADSAALAAAITCLLSNPARANEMGLAGRERVRSMLDPKALLAQIEDVYSFVLSGNGERQSWRRH